MFIILTIWYHEKYSNTRRIYETHPSKYDPGKWAPLPTVTTGISTNSSHFAHIFTVFRGFFLAYHEKIVYNKG